MPSNKYTTDTGLFLFIFEIQKYAVDWPLEVRGRVLRTLQLYGEEIKRDFEQTVSTWRDPAVFDVPVVRYSGGLPRIKVTTDSDKWRWLNEGTSVRWAGMHRDFRPKTAPGKWAAGPGAGNPEPQWRGYATSRANPGIEARDWTGQAKKRHREKLKVAIRKAIREGFRAAGKRP